MQDYASFVAFVIFCGLWCSGRWKVLTWMSFFGSDLLKPTHLITNFRSGIPGRTVAKCGMFKNFQEFSMVLHEFLAYCATMYHTPQANRQTASHYDQKMENSAQGLLESFGPFFF